MSEDDEHIDFGRLSLRPLEGEDYNAPCIVIDPKFWALGKTVRDRLLKGWATVIESLHEMSDSHTSEVDLVSEWMDELYPEEEKPDKTAKIIPFDRGPLD